MKKRLLSFLLALAMIFSMVPVLALAATTYHADTLMVFNTNTATEYEELSEGTVSINLNMVDDRLKNQKGGLNTRGVQKIYVDEQTGKTMTVLEPDHEDPVPIAEKDGIIKKNKSIERREVKYVVGSRKTIVADGCTKTMKCLYEGKYCTVWIATNDNPAIILNDTQAKQIGQEFDANYLKVKNMFGTMYDADGDGKVAIFCHDIDNNYGDTGGAYVAGYFWMVNMLDSSGYINGFKFGTHSEAYGMDCIHLDTSHGMGKDLSNISGAYSTLYHELQHGINFTYGIKGDIFLGAMDAYLDEAFSMAAEHQICGYSAVSERVAWFNDPNYYVPGWPLTFWADDLSNYSNSYLFGQYLRTRYAQQVGGDGSGLFRAIMLKRTDTTRDLDIITGLLNTTSAHLIKDFWMAVYYKDPSGVHGFNGESWADEIDAVGYGGSGTGTLSVYNGSAIFLWPEDGTTQVESTSGVETIPLKPGGGGITPPITDISKLFYITFPMDTVTEFAVIESAYPWVYNTSFDRFESSNQGRKDTTSTITLSFKTLAATTLSFDYGVSSEATNDILNVTLDGTSVVYSISGVKQGNVTKNLSTGEHTLVVSYTKNSTVDEGFDLAWIKDVVIRVACPHASTYDTYTPLNNNRHTVKTVCSSCEEVISSVTQACMDSNTDNKCDDCGGIMLCLHESTRYEYTSLGDRTHTEKTVCNVCEEEVSSQTQACTDSDTDRKCDHCGGDTPCLHESVRYEYVSLGNRWHTKKKICSSCGELISSLKWPCADSNTDWKCDHCGGDMPCLHESTQYEYVSLGKNTHTQNTICSSCAEQISAVTEACTDEDKDKICDLCSGTIVCGHYELLYQGMYVPLGSETHEVQRALMCANCGETFASEQKTGNCVDGDGNKKCDLCSGEIAAEETVASGSCGTNARWEVTDTGRLIITGYGVVKDSFTVNLVPWKNYTSSITEVVIAEGITAIGSNSFKNCTNLTDVYFFGTQEQWDAITIGTNNAPLTAAELHLSSAACAHSEVEIEVQSAQDHRHNVAVSCTACDEVVLTALINCYDADDDAACDICGGEIKTEEPETPEVPEEPVIIEKFTVAGCNMTLGNELELNIFLPKSTVDAYGKELTATVTHHAVDEDVIYTWKVSELPLYSGTRYYKASIRVAAAQMTDLVDIVVTDRDGNVYNNDYVTSVRTYVTNNIDKQKAAAKTLLVDMVNYGAAAQDNFKYRQDDYANAELTEAHKALATPSVACKDIRVQGTNYKGSNLSLQDRILLNFFFKAVDDAALSKMYATVAFTGVLGNEVEETVKPTKKSGYTCVAVDQIVLADAVCPVTVTVYNADGTVYGSATDSVESYNARQNPNGTNALYTNIMKFAAAALAYKNS